MGTTLMKQREKLINNNNNAKLPLLPAKNVAAINNSFISTNVVSPQHQRLMKKKILKYNKNSINDQAQLTPANSRNTKYIHFKLVMLDQNDNIIKRTSYNRILNHIRTPNSKSTQFFLKREFINSVKQCYNIFPY